MNEETRIVTGTSRDVEKQINSLRQEYTVAVQGFSSSTGIVFVLLQLSDIVE